MKRMTTGSKADSMTAQPQLRGYYWRQQALIGNLGDALTPLILHGLGYDLVSQRATGARLRNPGRCLLVIGSLLAESNLAALQSPADVWGCGWRGVALPAPVRDCLRIYAVRGPQTAAGLGLPAKIPLGDPALLLPKLAPRPIAHHGRSVVVPHLHRTRCLAARVRCRLTGCDEMVATQVFQCQGIGQPGWQRQALFWGKLWLRQGVCLYTTWGAVERIAGARFVLTGSLHGAILAQTYGVPWAAYDDGYIDVPSKWADWAAYLGVQLQFVTTLAAGQAWWQCEGQRGVVRDLDGLLDAFPYPVVTT